MLNDEFLCTHCDASSAQSLSELLLAEPEVVIIDVNPPASSALTITRNLLRELPETKIVWLVATLNWEVLHEAMVEGVLGFLPKPIPTHQMSRFVQFVALGNLAISEELAQRLGNRRCRPDLGSEEQVELSRVEMQMMDSVARGSLNKEIADEIGVSVPVVKKRIRRIRFKLRVSTRAEAVHVWTLGRGRSR